MVNRPSESHRNMKWLYEQVNAGNPVVVMMSLDTFQFQHSSPLSPRPIDFAMPVENRRSSFTFAGVVIGYNTEDKDNAYWTVLVPRQPADNYYVKVKMNYLTDNGKDFGRLSRRMVAVTGITEMSE